MENLNCIIGVSFKDKGYILDVMDSPEFSNTGLNIISWLRENKTSFVSEVFKYQDFGIVYSISRNSINTHHKIKPIQSEFNDISLSLLQKTIDLVDYVYIYSIIDDLLLIKTPKLSELIALDYKNQDDVNLFLEKVENEIHSF